MSTSTSTNTTVTEWDGQRGRVYGRDESGEAVVEISAPYVVTRWGAQHKVRDWTVYLRSGDRTMGTADDLRAAKRAALAALAADETTSPDDRAYDVPVLEVGAHFTRRQARPWTDSNGARYIHSYSALSEVVEITDDSVRYLDVEVLEEVGRPHGDGAAYPVPGTSGGVMLRSAWDRYVAEQRVILLVPDHQVGSGLRLADVVGREVRTLTRPGDYCEHPGDVVCGRCVTETWTVRDDAATNAGADDDAQRERERLDALVLPMLDARADHTAATLVAAFVGMVPGNVGEVKIGPALADAVTVRRYDYGFQAEHQGSHDMMTVAPESVGEIADWVVMLRDEIAGGAR